MAVSKGSIMHMLVPVFNIALGYWVFKESFTAREWVGAALVIFACIGVISSKSLRFRFFGPR